MTVRANSPVPALHRQRSLRIVAGAIDMLRLDLSKHIVLTEVGSGLFAYTPIIAALAGAARVFAWTRDTPFGGAAAVVEECQRLAELADVDASAIVFSANARPSEHVAQATIITNSGHVRPLDGSLLRCADATRVSIPLMYEAWELRATDIDIDYCRQRGIPVAGTFENHPDLKIFDCCEQLLLKLCMEAGYEISGNRVIVWSNDHFGQLALSGLNKLGAAEIIQTTDVQTLYQHANDADFVMFCDYMSRRCLIGEGGEIDARRLFAANPALGIVHLCGDIDDALVKACGLGISPDERGLPVRMSRTLAHLGPRPVLLLQAAGLKVGQLLSERRWDDPLVQLLFRP